MSHKILSDEETVKVLLASTGGMLSLFSNLDIVLKIIIGILTAFYLILKIRREIIEHKTKKNATGQNNN